MTLETREPTGKPNWPLVVLGGREKSGKTWAALLASASELVDGTFYIGIGEDDPDEYALIPGARFRIVLHNGTYDAILQAIRDVAALPPVDGKPQLMVVDSMTKLWDLIVDNMQAIANQRAKGRKTASGDYSISADLWNVAANQWKAVMDAIRDHRGPAILTARLDEVMVMENGQPTTQKRWKVQAHKSLVFDAGVLVEMHERGHALITGTKSVRMSLEKPIEAPGFTIKDLWERLGITAETEMGERTHASTTSDDISPEAVLARWVVKAKEQTDQPGFERVYADALNADVGTEVLDAIKDVAAAWRAHAAPPLDGVPAGKEQPRAWLDEAKGMKYSEDVAALWKEADALKAHPRTLSALAELVGRLPSRPPTPDPDAAWAPVAEDVGAPAVLDEAIAEVAK